MNAFRNVIVLIKVAAEALFLFGLFGWLYGVSVQLLHPNFLSEGLSHLTPWLRVDTFTILSFGFSALGFLIWRLVVELFERPRKPGSS
jgi:hypothetical protein